MKKGKRILAFIGVFLLIGLYLSTLVFALIGSPEAMNWLKASVFATIVVPILLWTYMLVYRLLKNHSSLRNDKAGVQKNEQQNSKRV